MRRLKIKLIQTLITYLVLAPPLIQAAPSCPSRSAVPGPKAVGLCANVIMSHFQMPRGLTVLADGSLLVTDMMRWDAKAGRVYRVYQTTQGWQRQLLLSGLDRPHGIAQGPDGKIYVGEVGRIIRFPLDQVQQRETVISLPLRQRHPLTTFSFAPQGYLYVNIGSSSNNCETATPAQRQAGRCPESEGPQAAGVVRKYYISSEGRIQDLGIFAQGLRNSMALAIHPESGLILQLENSRDAINIPLRLPNDNELPHDEMNVLQAGQHYGWPFCYDKQRNAPEFPRYACKNTTPPYQLLPAHAAPLGATWWRSPQAPARYAGWLVASYHGYRQYGHRIVAWPVDAQGLPNAQKSVTLLGPWRYGKMPGGPVEIRVGQDGALYFTDDRQGQLIRLAALGQ